jgi:hypothetical protein
MLQKTLMLGLLALLAATTSSLAQTAPPAAASAPAANPVDPASVQALKDMGAYLATLKHFRVETRHSGERVLQDGQKLVHLSTASMDVSRPDRIHVTMRSARSERQLYFDGKAVTLYTPAQKYYSSVPFSGNISALVDLLEARYGVQLPLQDLFLWGTEAASVDKIESAMNAGQDIVDGAVCDHYAFRQGRIDWQIWIQAGDKPLPRMLVITNRADEARPQSVALIDWESRPSLKDSAFSFVPPKGTKKIEIVPLKK